MQSRGCYYYFRAGSTPPIPAAPCAVAAVVGGLPLLPLLPAVPLIPPCSGVQDGYTALMGAAKYDSLEVVKELLNRGADANLQDKVSHPMECRG